MSLVNWSHITSVSSCLWRGWSSSSCCFEYPQTSLHSRVCMYSSHWGRWENSRPTHLSFGVRKRNCLFWYRITKATLQPLISPSLSSSAFMCLQLPPLVGVRSCLYSVLQCCTRSFNQITPGLFGILLSSSIFSPAHPTLTSYFSLHGYTWRFLSPKRTTMKGNRSMEEKCKHSVPTRARVSLCCWTSDRLTLLMHCDTWF